MKLYRCLTGPDDKNFCLRVSQALSQGWELVGGPTLTFDALRGCVIVGQAVTKEVQGQFTPDMDLSAY
jgi:Uncharacterized conserved small protein